MLSSILFCCMMYFCDVQYTVVVWCAVVLYSILLCCIIYHCVVQYTVLLYDVLLCCTVYCFVVWCTIVLYGILLWLLKRQRIVWPLWAHVHLFTFLQLASSSLLRLGSENEKEAVRNRESVYILLDLVSPLPASLPACLPASLPVKDVFWTHGLSWGDPVWLTEC